MAISTACCKISGCTGSFNRTESLYTEEKSRRCSVGYTIADRSSRYQVFGVCFGFDFDISDSSFRCCWHEFVNTQHIAVHRAICKNAAFRCFAAHFCAWSGASFVHFWNQIFVRAQIWTAPYLAHRIRKKPKLKSFGSHHSAQIKLFQRVRISGSLYIRTFSVFRRFPF